MQVDIIYKDHCRRHQPLSANFICWQLIVNAISKYLLIQYILVIYLHYLSDVKQKFVLKKELNYKYLK